MPPGQIVEPAEQVARLAVVNFAGPAALAAALATRMVARGRGRILLVGSAAAFHALPHAPTYAASKAGLARFADALRLAVAPHGVTITLVSPGFIDWAGGGRPVPRALLLPLEEAARRILAAFDAGVGHAIIPRRFALLRLLDRALPGVARRCPRCPAAPAQVVIVSASKWCNCAGLRSRGWPLPGISAPSAPKRSST